MSAKATPDSFWARTMYVGDCVIWTGWVNASGYGRLMYCGSMLLAHRLAYMLVHGGIEPGLEIDHLCRNTLCVNPAHLEAVTQLENARRTRGFTKDNSARVRTHCKRAGHPLSRYSSGSMFSGKSYCNICHREDRSGR